MRLRLSHIHQTIDFNCLVFLRAFQDNLLVILLYVAILRLTEEQCLDEIIFEYRTQVVLFGF